MAFAHLNVRTHYSFLESTIKVPDLVKAAKQAGMTAVAMTDKGQLYGAMELQKYTEKEGVKAIFGAEVLVVEKDRTDPKDRRTTSLVLLCETLAGYQNLLHVVSHGFLEGFQHGVPRVDRALLAAHTDGLIALSGGLAGDVTQAVLRGDLDGARQRAEGWRALFGPEHFFLEVQDVGFTECPPANDALLALGEELGLGCVATNAVRYLKQDDARAHAALLCVGMNKSYRGIEGDIPNGFWFKPEAAMREALPGACVDRAAVIADRCNVKIPVGKTFLPNYPVPEGVSRPDFLRQTAREGLERRFQEMDARKEAYDRAAYTARLELEVDVIVQMDFPGYFLIVWDFIAEAKRLGVPVGPGRGSGAGSLCAYALTITDIDPMKYGLLFERFLNPERVSMPDFDIDFCMDTRGKVIEYVSKKYGQHQVGQIITYGALKAKAVLRDIGRVMDLSVGEVNRLAGLVPEELGITLADARTKEPRIDALIAEDARYGEVFEMGQKLENCYRHAGVHAAGIVISGDPLWHYVPICRGANGELVTQYAKDEVEQAGLVKFDFLGLKTLTVLDIAVRIINETRTQDLFDLRAIPMDDRPTFELLSSGDTTGVFQLESSGFKELMRKLKPDLFEDVVAAVALYRPGPLQSGMVDDFVKCKHGEKEVTYPHPALAECLHETYGVIVYQEQVMTIARVIAGYTLGGADLLRRAMGKKKPEEMKKQRDIFLAGAVTTGICPADKAGEIFDLMAYFAGYGFNKSHSAAYALISYQTAYLKAHHPVEFMAALLTCDGDNTDKIVRLVGDARQSGLRVLPPDVNASRKGFSVDAGAIRFGLGAIKNVGEGAVDTILEARTTDGAFSSLFDFTERVDMKRINRRVLEALVKSGAFDGFGQERHVLWNSLDRAIDHAATKAREAASGQTSLFDLFGSGGGGGGKAATNVTAIAYATGGEVWSDKQRLAFEKEAIGFYVSGHPLDRWQGDIARLGAHTTAEIERFQERQEVTVAGVVASLRERPMKSGDGRMGFVMLEDLRGQVECLFFRGYADAEAVLKSDEPIAVTGHIKREGDDEDSRVVKIQATRAVKLSDLRRDHTKKVILSVNADHVNPAHLHKLRDLCRAHPGRCSVSLEVVISGVGRATVLAHQSLVVDPADEFLAAAERVLGPGAVRLG